METPNASSQIPNPKPVEPPSKTREVGIFLLQSFAVWLVLVVGCIVFDHFKRPENTPMDSFRSIALVAVFAGPFFAWRLRRIARL